MNRVSFELPKPTWRKCDRCGEDYMGAFCGTCEARAFAASQATDRLRSSIPPGFAWASFLSADLVRRVKPATSIPLARDAAASERVVLTGSAGAGKTSLAVCMARLWAKERGLAPLFVSCPAFASARMRTPFGREANAVVEALSAPLLVLDDMGTPKTEPASSPLVEVVFARYDARLPTWVTTWMSPDDCTERYGDGVTRRLFERARVIRLEGSR